MAMRMTMCLRQEGNPARQSRHNRPVRPVFLHNPAGIRPVKRICGGIVLMPIPGLTWKRNGHKLVIRQTERARTRNAPPGKGPDDTPERRRQR